MTRMYWMRERCLVQERDSRKEGGEEGEKEGSRQETSQFPGER